MLIGRLKIDAKRWPWQEGYSWHGIVNSTAPLNQPKPGERGAPRFGGGWKYKFGFAWGGRTLHLDLVFGMVTFSWLKRCKHCGAKVGEYHTTTCPAFRTYASATSWLNKESGF